MSHPAGVRNRDHLARAARIAETSKQGVEDPLASLASVELLDLVNEDPVAMYAQVKSGGGSQRENPALASLSKWARLDSNQGPTDYESAALTS